ncbi:MAG: NEW3 domain-containing protein [Nitrospirota bacterium]|nr:NEW3 domain-containing protein [Nitrospirota bacterium]
MNIRFSLSLVLISAVIVAFGSTQGEAVCLVADTYSLTTPATTSATMGDATATLPITVANTSATKVINFVHIELNAALYNVSLLSSAPAGWTVSQIKNAGAGQSFIEYTATAGGIPIGGSLAFNVIVTGTTNGPIPSDTQDRVDTLNAATYVSGPGCNPFALSGGLPTWTRKALSASMTATPSSVGSGGMITIIMTVTNRSSAAQANVQPANAALTINATGTANAALNSGPTPASTASLAAGASATYQWLYTASGSGSLQFCNSGRNGAGTATSLNACSNTVSVGNFTATITVTPAQIVSGQDVTVTMTVTNNGSTSIQGISPTLNPPAGSSHVSGPSPASVGNLAAGASSSFQWTYTLTGAVGSVFTFTGFATDNGGVNSLPNPSVSNPVVISAYSVTVSPATVASGSANVTFTFRVTNNGGYGLQQVLITPPSAGFVYSAASGGCAAPAWIVTTGGAPTWTNFRTAADYVPALGGVCDFTVTYASVPTVAVNTDYNFRVDLWDTQTPTNKEPRASLGVIVKITAYAIVLTASPGSIDPNCASTITATVTPAPPNGSIVNFLETAGTLDPHMAATTGGVAQTTLRAPNPYNALVPSAIVTGTFQDASANVVVNFTNTGAACLAGMRILHWREVVN